MHQGIYIKDENLSQRLPKDNIYEYAWDGSVSPDGTEYTYIASLTKIPNEGRGTQVQIITWESVD